MTTSLGLTRLGPLLAALAAIAVLVFGAALLLVDRDELRAMVAEQVRAATGLQFAVNGDTDVSLFPSPSVTFRDASFGGNAPVLTVDELTANLRLPALLLRRFEIADLVLSQPLFLVKINPQGVSNWTPLVDRLSEQMARPGKGGVSFSEVRIRNGVLSYQDDLRGILEKASRIEVSLAWPSIARSFGATGALEWRGELIDGSVNIGDLAAFLAGKRSGFRTRLAAPHLKFAFEGSATNNVHLVLDGSVTADAASLRDAMHWMGHDLPPGNGFGRFSLKAQARASTAAVSLTKVNIDLDGNVAEGAVNYGGGERRAVQATLAAETLDLSPYVNTARLVASGARDWNRQPFDLRGLDGGELDIRLSAGRVAIANSRAGRTALGLNLRDGVLTLSIGEAQIYGGILRGSLGLARHDSAADVKAQVIFSDVDLEACLGDLMGVRRLTGRGDIAVTAEARGSNPFGLAQTVDGRATLMAQDGALSGMNLEQLLRRLERRPLAGSGDLRSGKTPFKKLNVALRLNDGLASTEEVRLEGNGLRVTLAGTSSIPARDYDLKGVAALAPPAGAPGGFELPFIVQGPWDDPLVFPDPESLLRRAPASAPLLDAIRDSRARDQVKSAIERLTGGRASPPAPAAAPAAEGQQAH
ncbi:MAG: AsmA family protein [Xanthobacteraceae bacterium]